jgi:hypothetical protein
MPECLSLPERMRPVIPANGYESPNEFCSGRADLESDSERRRNTYFWGSDITHTGSLDSSNTNGVLARSKSAAEDKQVQPTRPVAIRDRIGCFTWTWFTMVCCTSVISFMMSTDIFVDNGTFHDVLVEDVSLTVLKATGGIANVLHSSEYHS